MTKEQDYFLRLLANHLNNGQSEMIADLDWENLYEIAQSQQMSAIICYQCKSFSEFSNYTSFYFSTISHYANYIKLINEIKSAFEQENIKYFVVKGIEIAKYYPIPALRTMGDIDIVTDDRDSAKIILEGLGFHYDFKELCDDWKFYKNDYEIELHDRLLYDSAINTVELKNFFNSAFGFVTENNLDESFHFLFLIVHIRKHLMSYGIGFRQIFDIAIAVKNCSNLNWIWIVEKLEELKLLDFAKNLFALIEVWFDIKTPVEYAHVSEELYNLSATYIFSGGVFGFENEDTKKNVVANKINQSDHPVKDSIIRFVRIMFPKCETMKKEQEYQFLNKCPLLLPVAWILRVWNVFIKNGVKGTNKMINQSFVSVSYAKNRKEYLAKWGLSA